MYAAAAASQLHRIFQMQHFVVDDVLHRREWNARVIEDSAYDDGIVRRIVMAQTTTGQPPAPRHPWACQQAMEESGIQPVENSFQIVNASLRRLDAFAPPNLPQQMRLLSDVMA